MTVRAGARAGAALAALGLGLVAAGLGAGHLAEHPTPVGLLVGGALVVLAAAALGWAVLALRGPVRGPRATVGVLLAVGPAVLLSPVPTGTPPGPGEAIALLLAVSAAAVLAVGLRLGATGRRPTVLGQVGSLALAALLVAAVTVPGLAATDAGEHAVPHGSHGLPAERSHHGG